ncbi:hypothetical protein EIP91_002644 [Steccherinum ochraceum]|uniref:Uncharacterized protein n=1 Tax=Steccherinum ochraceum TaxID=92696 RepID=A0A4R0S2I4_9APHY|nr:hypothetical protein EIP91_002644 [Steccherinum ochraceum]
MDNLTAPASPGSTHILPETLNEQNDQATGISAKLDAKFEPGLRRFLEGIRETWPARLSNSGPDVVQDAGYRTREEGLAALETEEELYMTKVDFWTSRLQSASVQARLNIASRRNALAPIHMLPQQILSDIFRCATLGSNRSARGSGSVALSISHTCSYWRAVAIEDHSLWSTILLSSINITQANVHAKNSGTVPLRIHLDIRRPLQETELTTEEICDWGAICANQLQFCRVNLQKAETLILRLQDQPPSIKHLIAWIVTGSAPRLKHASIESHVLVHIPRLFDGKSDLETLVLFEVIAPWSALAIMGNLTKLHLHLGAIPDRARRQMDVSLFDMLLALSMLEDLSLWSRDRLPAMTITHPNDRPELVHLASLKSLSVKLQPQDVEVFLRNIATPHSMEKIHIAYYGTSDNVEGAIAIPLPTDQRCLPALRTVNTLCLDSFNGIYGSLPSSTARSLLLAPALQGTSDAVVAECVAATFNVIANYYPMQHLSTLSTYRAAELELHGEFATFLRGCPHIREIHFAEKRSSELVRLANHLAHDQPPLCPLLDVVRFSDSDVELHSLDLFCQAFFADSTYRVPTGGTLQKQAEEDDLLRGRCRGLTRVVKGRSRTFFLGLGNQVWDVQQGHRADVLWDVTQ